MSRMIQHAIANGQTNKVPNSKGHYRQMAPDH